MFKTNVYYVLKTLHGKTDLKPKISGCASALHLSGTAPLTCEGRHQSRAHVQMSNERTRFQQHRHHQVNIEMREHFGHHLIQKLFSLQGSNSIPEQDSSLLAAV